MTTTVPESAREALKIAVRASERADGQRPVALHVTETFGLADIFLIVSASVERQVQAVARDIEDDLNDAGFKTVRREGRELGRWVLLDFGDLIVHVFHEEEREFYALERLWGDAPLIQLPELGAASDGGGNDAGAIDGGADALAADATDTTA